MSIIITPEDGTAFTTAELTHNFERLAYLSTQHGDEPEPDPIVPDPIVPSAEYTLHDVWNNVFRNVPNWTTYMSKIRIWDKNITKNMFRSFPGVTDAEWDALVLLLVDDATPDGAITDWLDNSVNASAFTKTHLKDMIDVIITILNRGNKKILNVCFNLTLSKFTSSDKAQLFLAIDNLVAGDDLANDPYYIKLDNLIAEHDPAWDQYMLPLLDERAIDIEAAIDRLTVHKNEAFAAGKIVTCHTDWTPATGGVSTVPTLNSGSHMMTKLSALLSAVIAEYNI
jgi:hypothetical protein